MQTALRPASRADWTPGNSRPIRIEMIEMTTRSSIRVKPRARRVIAEPPMSALPHVNASSDTEQADYPDVVTQAATVLRTGRRDGLMELRYPGAGSYLP